MGLTPGDQFEQNGFSVSKEQAGEWRRFIPEIAWPEDKDIPYAGAMNNGSDGRSPSEDAGVVEYLRKLYGPDVEVRLVGRFRRPDGSGVSYWINKRGDDERINHLATFESVNTTINLMPEYKGRLRAGWEAVQERNRFLTQDSRMEDFRATVWKLDESPEAANTRSRRREVIQKWEGRFTPVDFLKGSTE